MRALHIALFVLCLNLALLLVRASPDMVGAAPSQSSTKIDTTLELAVTAVIAGGIGLLGYSFKLTAVITLFSTVYAASVANFSIFLLNFTAIPAVVVAVFTTLETFVGVVAVIQLAGGGFVGLD